MNSIEQLEFGLRLELPDGYIIKPQARPRDRKGGGKYNPSKKWRDGLAEQLKYICLDKYGSVLCFDGKVKVAFVLCQKSLRGDIDNYTKIIHDSIEKSGIIKNDKQITQACQKIYNDENSLEIVITYAPKNHICKCQYSGEENELENNSQKPQGYEAL